MLGILPWIGEKPANESEETCWLIKLKASRSSLKLAKEAITAAFRFIVFLAGLPALPFDSDDDELSVN